MDTCVTETRAHCEAPREAEDDLTLVHATKRGSVASPPTPPAVLSATPPCVTVLRSLPQSWQLPDRFYPGLERTPSAVRSPNQCRQRSIE
jgi:hypothetical protein